MEQIQNDAEIVARVAAVDIGKAEVVCCCAPRARPVTAAGASGSHILGDDPVGDGGG